MSQLLKRIKQDDIWWRKGYYAFTPTKADIANNTVKTENIFYKIPSVDLTTILYFYSPVLLMRGLRRWLRGQEHCCASKRTWVWILRAHRKVEHLHMPGMLVLGDRRVDSRASLGSQPRWNTKFQVRWETRSWGPWQTARQLKALAV